MAYIQLVTIHAKPGSAGKIVEHLKKIQAESINDEPGTKLYETAQDPADENLIVIYEEYVDEAARDEHRKGSAFGFFAAERDSLIQSISIQRLDKFK